jgi:hypothetical protein
VKKNMLEVYAFAACFVSMIVVIMSTSLCLYGVIRITAPSVTVAGHTREWTMSNDQFLKTWAQGRPKPDASTTLRMRTEAWESALRTERHDGRTFFLQTLMFAVTAGLVFLFHWRIGTRQRATQ